MPNKVCEKPTLLSEANFQNLDKTRQIRFLAVKDAIQHAWKGYAETANLRAYTSVLSWRYWFSSLVPPADDLAPLSKSGIRWLNSAATLYDSLDTLYLAGLLEEYEFASDLAKRLPLPLAPTKTFEYSIRVLGGLLGGYSVSGDVELLSAARRIADSMLEGAFKSSPTALPRMYDIVAPAKISQSVSYISWAGNKAHNMWARIWRYGRDYLEEHKTNSLAGVGSFALEFSYLSMLTGDAKYIDAANNIFVHVMNGKEPRNQLIPMLWNTISGRPISPHFTTLGSGSDSFYEYLIKTPILLKNYSLDISHDNTMQMMSRYVDQYKKVIHQSFLSETAEKHVSKQLNDDNYSNVTIYFPIDEQYKYGHLLCYVPGMLALGERFYEDSKSVEVIEMARNLTSGCWATYQKSETGLGPEEIHVSPYFTELSRYKITNSGYFLRPELVESLFIMYKLSGDEIYQEMAWNVFQSLERFLKRDLGYVGLLNVDEPTKAYDEMPSFFIAETLKYLLLTFSPNDYVDLDTFVFTTEAHPLRQVDQLVLPDIIRCLQTSMDLYQPISPFLVIVANLSVYFCTFSILRCIYRSLDKNGNLEKKKL